MLSDVKELVGLIGEHGPYAVTTAVFAAMWYFERREVKLLQAKMIKLSAVVLAYVRTHGQGGDK